MTELNTYRQVIQAFLDGKEVEYYDVRLKQWIEQESMVSLYIEDLDNPTVSDYRIAQELIKIGDVEFPKPETVAPQLGQQYYVPDYHLISSDKFNVITHRTLHWADDKNDRQYLKRGLVHLSNEAAIEHATALILLSGGSVD